jgi:hypothetical protein
MLRRLFTLAAGVFALAAVSSTSHAQTCTLEIHTRTAFGESWTSNTDLMGVHDVAVIKYQGETTILNFQTKDTGFGAIFWNDDKTCNWEMKDGQIRDPLHDTRPTWVFSLPVEKCRACYFAYTNEQGFEYKGGDSNWAMDACFEAMGPVTGIHSEYRKLVQGGQTKAWSQWLDQPAKTSTQTISHLPVTGPDGFRRTPRDAGVLTWLASASIQHDHRRPSQRGNARTSCTDRCEGTYSLAASACGGGQSWDAFDCTCRSDELFVPDEPQPPDPPTPVCGDGRIDAPETCENNSHCSSGSTCGTSCNCISVHTVACGDGQIDYPETCESDWDCAEGSTCGDYCNCIATDSGGPDECWDVCYWDAYETCENCAVWCGYSGCTQGCSYYGACWEDLAM